MSEFYILSLKWTNSAILTWWRPNSCGYTQNLDHAGRYTREEVIRKTDAFERAENCVALPCEIVDAAASRAVFDFSLGDRIREAQREARGGAKVNDLSSLEPDE